MRRMALLFMAVCAAMCFAETQTFGQTVTFGTWLQEGTGSVTGSGNSFTASPTAIATADNGDNFAVRNAERHRVYQTFSAMDFSTAGDEVHVTFDITFNGMPENLDSGVRVSLVDTTTNQGIYPVGWDGGGRVGTYHRTRFVDNLDGATGDAHGGAFNDAINGSGTLGQSNAAPTISGGAIEEGLIDGNTVSFKVVLTRNAGNSFTYTTDVTEKNGFVVYPQIGATYDPVSPSSGDTSVANVAVNSFDGIVFGLFSDDPFATNPGSSYTVSNICVSDTDQGVVLVSEPFDYPDGDLVGNGGWVGYGSDQSNPVQVESGQAVIARPDGVQDVNHPFAGAPGTLYYSLEFSVDDLGAPYPLDGSPDFEYFATFYDGTGGDNLSARLDIQAPSGAGDFTVGIASDNGTADATWATDLTFGTTYRAVVSYDQVDNLATLWIDPVLESDTSILGANLAVVGDTISAVALRQASSDGAETVRIDNLMVGTSFKSVVPAPPAPAILLGDVNQDGSVDFLDISPFIAVLSGGTFQAEADCNEDGSVNFLDISPFIAILSGP